jgi:hypothetical protein
MNNNVYNSFRPEGLEGFKSMTRSTYETSPPYTIAQVARDRITDKASLMLPDGYDDEVLNRICWLSGQVNVEFAMSLRQGYELREIGAQILELDNEDKIMPPLGFEETQAIRRLVQVVDSTNTILSHKQ